MIPVSFLLVLVAIAALAVSTVAGWLLGAIPPDVAFLLVNVSIGITVVAAVFLAAGAYRIRHELFGGGGVASRSGVRPAGSSAAARARTAKPKQRPPGSGQGARKPPTRPARTAAGGRPSRDTGSRSGKQGKASPALGPEVSDGAAVVVVPGRKRYHLSNCRQLVGRTREELTYGEAREEGFTPCTACVPDAALAARAGAGDPEEPAPKSESSDEGTSEHGFDNAADEAPNVGDETADPDDKAEEADDDAAASEDDTPEPETNGEDKEPERSTEEFAAVSGSADDDNDDNDASPDERK